MLDPSVNLPYVATSRSCDVGGSPVTPPQPREAQAMPNLIVDAVEAMSTSGIEPRDLRTSTARVRLDALFITVQDSGPDVDSADLARVFDAFYSTKSQGSGMGLSICRAILECHGGKLWISAGVRRGAIL